MYRNENNICDVCRVSWQQKDKEGNIKKPCLVFMVNLLGID